MFTVCKKNSVVIFWSRKFYVCSFYILFARRCHMCLQRPLCNMNYTLSTLTEGYVHAWIMTSHRIWKRVAQTLAYRDQTKGDPMLKKKLWFNKFRQYTHLQRTRFHQIIHLRSHTFWIARRIYNLYFWWFQLTFNTFAKLCIAIELHINKLAFKQTYGWHTQCEQPKLYKMFVLFEYAATHKKKTLMKF